MNWPTEWTWWLAGGATALVASVAALPWLVQPILRALLWPHYAIRVRGLEHLPRTGPALLAVNHVTWLDGFFLAAACPRRGRALVNANYINWPGFRHLARHVGLIPVPATGPRAQRAAIEAARAALERGQVVAIFPEAQLSRNGLTGHFLRGLELMLPDRKGGTVPVIPVFLDHLWGSAFSFAGGRTFARRPGALLRRRAVGIAFGPPVAPPITADAVRRAVIEAGVRAFELRPGPTPPLETLDPALPRLVHPEFGLLAASTADYDRDGIKQTGQKPGTLGQPVPGVALRAVDDDGKPLPAETAGRLQALLAGKADWVDLGTRGSLDKDGFVRAS